MPASSAVVTVPNILSFARIATIPLFCWLTANEQTRIWGILLFAVVVSTDWVDGQRRASTGQVTELGRLLDPIADRLAIAAGLVTFAIVDLPFWAALLILVRDVVVVLGGAVLLWGRNIRVEVRGIGRSPPSR